MGACDSKFMDRENKYGLSEWYMESENYVQLSVLISNPNFNYMEKIPVEFHKKDSSCSYLHLAAKFDSVIFINMWLQKGYPVNVTDYRGWSALHWAVYYNSPNAFLLLLKSGIPLNISCQHIFKRKNQHLLGKTAVEMMYLLKRNDIIEIYENYHTSQLNMGNSTYVREEEYIQEGERDIPNAVRLSKMHTFDKLPKNYKKTKFTLIQNYCGWNVYSDKFGEHIWKNSVTGQIYKKCPNQLRNICTLSYYNESQ